MDREQCPYRDCPAGNAFGVPPVRPPLAPTRKLIEVALPLEAVNAAGRAEKAVPKRGHPATMHLWWSRKPLGVTRAVLFASLVDDPSARPDLFPTETAQEAERRRLFALIEELCRWERSGDAALLAEAQRCIEDSAGGDPPRIIDPFCGGGAIPVEALRLGLDTLAIDLNPVAALVSAATLSVAQRFAGKQPVSAATQANEGGLAGIAADVAFYGGVVEAECSRRLAAAFEPIPSPLSPDGCTVAISYLWARTIPCADPGCGLTTPLLSTWWLSKKPTNRWHARPVLTGDRFDFEVEAGAPPAGLDDLKMGRGTNFRCLFCGKVNDADWVRRCGLESGFDQRLVAIQAFADPHRPRDGRIWLAPDTASEQAGRAVSGGRFPPPIEAALDREVPAESGNVTTFGVRTFGGLLSPRQRNTLATFSEVIAQMTPAVHRDALAAGMPDDGAGIEQAGAGARAYAEAVTTYLALALSRMANRTTTMTTHNRANGSVEQSFIRPAYGFYGEFPEANPFSGSTGSWTGGLGYVVQALEALPSRCEHPQAIVPQPDPFDDPWPVEPRVGRSDVRCGSMLAALDGDTGMVCTDPPYYDMFDYASLSNLFLVWLRAMLADIWPSMLGPSLAPTDAQIVSNAARCSGDRSAAHDRFESLLCRAFERIADVSDPRYPVALYYGYQQAERRSSNGSTGSTGTAWEVMLESLIGAGLRITATWPLRTERPEGVKKGTRSLGTSLLFICRQAETGCAPRRKATDAEFRRALRSELGDGVKLLQQCNIAPLDLAQAVIGPGMRIYTGYSGILGRDGSRVGVSQALGMISEVFDESLSELDAELDAGSVWALNWFDAHGYAGGPASGAERLAEDCGITVAELIGAGIVAAADDDVRLLDREQLAARWDRAAARHPTVWQAAQHVLRCFLEGGEPAAAALLGRLDRDTVDGVRHVAHRLYRICTRRSQVAEAAACNSLVASWPALNRRAAAPAPLP